MLSPTASIVSASLACPMLPSNLDSCVTGAGEGGPCQAVVVVVVPVTVVSRVLHVPARVVVMV